MNLLTQNLILATDSYKVSHHLQFPEGMGRSFYYVEARGANHMGFDKIMVAGVHYLCALLEKGVSVADVEEANELLKAHFGQELFNYEGWMKIATELDGKIPVTIRAIEEGTVVPVKNAILTIITEEGYGWLAGYLETMILRACWYPTTVATISFHSKLHIAKAMRDTSDLTNGDFDFVLKTRLHDFGARGVSSAESAAIGGLAHLYNFTGTDTLESLVLARNLYGEHMAGISIPAREHSTTTCYLREGEYDAFMNSVRNFGGGYFAVVIDSYSTDAALEWLLTNEEFIQTLTEKGGTCVLRPDSGLPIDMVMKVLDRVADLVGFTRNKKGYKVLDPRFRVIQGDGVDEKEIGRIVNWACYGQKYSMENIAFGMGGGLLQHCDRDTQKFAMKCSAMEVNGVWRDVYKSPETDPSKQSKAGLLDTISKDGIVQTIAVEPSEFDPLYGVQHSMMQTVFSDGERVGFLPCLDDVRQLADEACEMYS